jgi:two-component system, NtrC family, sensor kinase
MPSGGTIAGRAALERRVLHVPDVLKDPEFSNWDGQKLGGFRCVLAVPMLREGVSIGILTLTRREARPFTDKKIELATPRSPTRR